MLGKGLAFKKSTLTIKLFITIGLFMESLEKTIIGSSISLASYKESIRVNFIMGYLEITPRCDHTFVTKIKKSQPESPFRQNHK